jgi:isocitrate dehydrogenase
VTKEIVGVDMFVEWNGEDAELLAKRLEPIAGPAFQLQMITNRGVKVWPNGIPETLKVDHWRCRFVARAEVGEIATHRQIAELMMRASDEGIDVIKTENLCIFDGEPGFSLGQGQ